jgi:hypothetical protein
VTAFQFNEELKERCILLGARQCFTKYIETSQHNGSPVWYNVIELPLQMHKNYVMVVCGLVDSYLEEFDFLGIDQSYTDVSLGYNGKYIVYCFYYNFETFTKKELILDK